MPVTIDEVSAEVEPVQGDATTRHDGQPPTPANPDAELRRHRELSLRLHQREARLNAD